MSKNKKETVGSESQRLPLGQAAKFIGNDLSPHTLRSWARQGKVSYIKAGRRLYFDKTDLLDLLRKSRVEARKGGAA